MNNKIIKKKTTFSVDNINAELYKLLKINKNLFNNINEYFDFAYKSNKNDIKLFLTNDKNEYCMLFEDEIYDSFVFFLEKFLNRSLLSIRISYYILNIINKIISNSKNIFDNFKLVKWPGSEKGMIYYNKISGFSDLLKEKVFLDKLSLKQAYLFHIHFKNNYDGLLNIIPDNFSFSNTTEIVKNVTEYSKKENKKLDEIINELKKDKDILNKSFNLKYPNYSKIKKIFNEYIQKIKLPGNIKLKYDEAFEKQDYSLEIKFNNYDSLRKKVKALNRIIEKSSFEYEEDMFIHDNLFKESKIKK